VKQPGRALGLRRQLKRAMHQWLHLASALVLALAVSTAAVAQDDPRAHLFALINQARLREGYAPLGNSTLLNQAAQRHAEDLASEGRRGTLGQVTHDGSDGSTYQQRIREARYQAWNDGLMVDEVLWTGLGTAEDALVWFRRRASADADVASDWEVLTDTRYREAGVGFAEDNGVRYFVVVVGSRPGVLPIFINEGAETTESPLIALRLTNEEAVPLGDGASIGRAIEVRMSNRPGSLPVRSRESMLFTWSFVTGPGARRSLKTSSGSWRRGSPRPHRRRSWMISNLCPSCLPMCRPKRRALRPRCHPM